MQRCLHFQRARRSMEVIADIVNRPDGRYNYRRNATRISSAEEHAFCNCYNNGRPRSSLCTCGEDDKILEWVWDVDTKSNCTHLVNDNKDVRFHLHFSGGTAVIRGNRPITDNQHYWEIKMTSLVYGTDMMVGVGTKDADIHKSSDKFCSVLGIDNETWGFSYTGLFHHQGVSQKYASGFGQGSIIGVHLDMWNGTMSFYKNRQPLGIACSGLKGKTLYPMVSSTAARSGMRIIHSVSFPTSLQFICCMTLRNAISADKSVLKSLLLPPGMQNFLANNLGWLLGGTDIVNDDAMTQPGTSSQVQVLDSVSPCFKKKSTCSHQHLTCNDCNTPVFSCSNRSVDNIDAFSDQSSSPPLSQVIVTPSVILFNHNRFLSETHASTSSEGTEDASSSASKKLKYSYEYAVGLVEDLPDSDDMSDND